MDIATIKALVHNIEGTIKATAGCVLPFVIVVAERDGPDSQDFHIISNVSDSARIPDVLQRALESAQHGTATRHTKVLQ